MGSWNAEWAIELFGGLRARHVEREITRFRTHKTACLLAYLAYYRLGPHPRDLLIDLLWGEGPPEAGRQSLSKALSSLRHQLEPPGVTPNSVLLADRSSVGLNPAGVMTDVAGFETALKEAARARGNLERVQHLVEAVQLYRGELLPGFYEEWVLRERERLRELLHGALSRLISHFEQAGDRGRALEYAQRAVGADPLREEAYAALIRLYAARGEPAEALREYAKLERMLREELALCPSAETQALVAALRAPTPTPTSAPTQKQSDPSPIARLPGKASLSALPGGTMTFLQIDWHEGRGAEGAAPAEGHGLLRREVGRHGGSEVEALGGALAFAFTCASDAAASAAACRQAWQAAGGGEAPRMALDTGDVELQAGRYRGVVLDRAARVLLAGHEGQILCSEQTAVLLRWDLEPGLRLIDLGLYRLGELPNSSVFPMPERLFQLESSSVPPRAFPALNAEGGYQARLPLPVTRFFGREAEIELLGKLLLAPERRLITLIGPGGSGKTRLALEVAGRLVEPFQGAVWFVSLVDVAEAHHIPQAILDVLRLAPTAGQNPLERAMTFLSRQPSLLVLDNFEHLVGEGAELVQRLVTGTPALTCLITSRQRLGLDGEREFRVLPLPTPQADDPPEWLARCESVRLFVDRAQAVQPDFQVTRGTARAIAALCLRLEGIPLALELAAARAAVLSPAQILARLDHRLDFLIRERRDVPARHRSLRAALDGSYQLLAPALQQFFARLSVFRGGWTLEAAEAVACSERTAHGSQLTAHGPDLDRLNREPCTVSREPPSALDVLAQLQECSLVVAEAGASETRYRMLETVREYAETLLSREQQAELSYRHASYFASYAEQAEAEWAKGAKAGATELELLADEHDNLRSALAWGMREEGEPELGVRLAAALWSFWPAYGHLQEGRQWLDEALRHVGNGTSSRIRARLRLGMGWLLQLHGEFASARSFCEESLLEFQVANDPVGTAHALFRLGWVAYNQNDLARARALWEQTLTLWKAAGCTAHSVELLRHLRNLVEYLGDLTAATTLQEEALALMRQLGEPAAAAARLMSGVDRVREQQDAAALNAIAAEGLVIAREYEPHPEIAQALDQVGLKARDMGEYQWARALLEQGLKMHRALEVRINIHLDLWRLAQVARLAGELSAARTWAEESLQVARELGSKEPIAHALDELRLVALKQADWQTARSLPRQSVTLWQELENVWGLAEALEGVAHLTIAQAEALEEQGSKNCDNRREAATRTARLLGAAARLRESIGQALQPHELADHTRSVQAAHAVIGDAAFTAAWAEGRALSPEQAVTMALEL